MNKIERADQILNDIFGLIFTILLVFLVIWSIFIRENPDPKYGIQSLTLLNIYDKNKIVIRNGNVMDHLPVFISNGYDQDFQIFEKDGTLYKNIYFRHGFKNIILDG